MTWKVDFNGRTLDVDPTEMTGAELKRVKLLTGLSYRELINGIGAMDGEAILAIFYIAELRSNPDLKYTEYSGPPVRVVLENIGGFESAMDAVGKATGVTSETNGGQPSPSSIPDSSTESSTTG